MPRNVKSDLISPSWPTDWLTDSSDWPWAGFIKSVYWPRCQDWRNEESQMIERMYVDTEGTEDDAKIERDTESQRHSQTDKQKNTDRETYRQNKRQTDQGRDTDRQRQRQWQTDRGQKETQRDIDVEMELTKLQNACITFVGWSAVVEKGECCRQHKHTVTLCSHRKRKEVGREEEERDTV